MNAKRGYVPEDEHNFSPAAIEKIRTVRMLFDTLKEQSVDTVHILLDGGISL